MTSRVLSGSVLEAASTDPATHAQRLQAKADFALEQARTGRLVDTTGLRAAVVDGISTVWEAGTTIDRVKEETIAGADGEVLERAYGIQTHPASLAESVTAATTGLGLETLQSMTGATFISGYCTTTGQADHKNKLTSCYQRYKLATSTSTRDYFFYNRWATGVGEAIDYAPDYQTTRVDVRAKPWAGGTGAGANVASLTDYWPKASVSNCSDHQIEVGYGNFSAKVPIQDCDELSPSPNATNKSMQVIYDQGSVFDGRVHGADMSLIYAAFKGASPQYADYSYAKFCRSTYSNCTGIARADSGWQ